MMPDFATSEKERYVLYLLPIIIPLGVSKIYNMLSSFSNGEKCKRIFEITVFGSILIYSVFTFVYSYDSFRYTFTGDKDRWHRATWYYKDYDWINRNISLDEGETILVMVRAQQTYYLKKPYINADRLSAAINWSNLLSAEQIVSMLDMNKTKYIFVDDGYLKGNRAPNAAMDILRKEHIIEKVRESKAKLYSSRIKNIYDENRTVLYKVK